MNKNFYFLLVFLSVVLLVPATKVAAFTPSNQTASKLADNVAVFTIDYAFGDSKNAIYVPVMGDVRPSATQFGFRVRANDEPGQYQWAKGFVVGDVGIENDMYVIKPGEVGHFTAVVIVAATAADTDDLYSIDISQLPFFFGKNKQPAPLNKSELETFVTPKVAL